MRYAILLAMLGGCESGDDNDRSSASSACKGILNIVSGQLVACNRTDTAHSEISDWFDAGTDDCYQLTGTCSLDGEVQCENALSDATCADFVWVDGRPEIVWPDACADELLDCR